MSARNDQITAGILAGGRGRRLGGRDKAWLRLAGRPQLERVVATLRRQVDRLLVNADTTRHDYARLGLPLVGDGAYTRAGPMAGIHALARACGTPYLLCVPVDAPRLPNQLAARMAQAVHRCGARAVLVHDGSARVPVCCLLHRDLATDASDYLERGGRSVDVWLRRLDAIEVGFADHPDGWSLNTPEELADWQARLAAESAA